MIGSELSSRVGLDGGAQAPPFSVARRCSAPRARAPSPTFRATHAQVLERLPARDGAEWQAIAALQAELARAPRDAALAAELAQRYLALFQRAGRSAL